jgi:hypothetical protein
MVFNPNIKKCYVGESVEFYTRYFSEMTHARTIDRKENTKYEKYVGFTGYFNWFVLPLNIDLNMSWRLRLKMERHFMIRYDPELNTKGKKTRLEMAGKLKTRSVMSLRMKDKPCLCGKNKPYACSKSCRYLSTQESRSQTIIKRNLTQHGVTTQTCAPLEIILQNATSNYIKLQKIGGSLDITNYTKLLDKFGESLIFTEGGSKSFLKHYVEKMKTSSSLSIRINKNIPHELFIRKVINKLANHKTAAPKELKKKPLSVFLDIYLRTDEILTEKLESKPTTSNTDLVRRRQRVQNKIMSLIRNKYGLKNLNNFTVSYPHSNNIDIGKLKKLTASILRKCDLRSTTRNKICEITRYVPTNYNNIKDMLVNNKNTCSTWNMDEPPKCTGGKRCVGEHHFEAWLKDMPGDPGTVGKQNSKLIPVRNPKNYTDTLKQAIAQYLKNIHAITTGTIKQKKYTSSKTVETSYQNMSFNDNNLITLYCNEKPQHITKKRLSWLYNRACKYQKKLSHAEFNRKLHQLVETCTPTVRKKFTPNNIKSVIIKNLNLTIERESSPLECDLRISNYTASWDTYHEWNTLPNTPNWTQHGILDIATSENLTEITDSLLDAIYHSNRGIDTAIILPIIGNDIYISILSHENVYLIASWDEDTFRFSKSPDYSYGSKAGKHPIAVLYVTSSKPTCTVIKDIQILNNEQITKELTQISRKQFKTGKINTLTSITVPLTQISWVRKQQIANLDYNVREQNLSCVEVPSRYKYFKITNKMLHTGDLELRGILTVLKIQPDKIDFLMKEIESTSKPEGEIRTVSLPTVECVLATKRQLNGLIISVLDKSEGHLYVECPLVHYYKLKKNTLNLPTYTVVDVQPKEILDKLLADTKTMKLDKLAKTLDGTLPIIYGNNKSKDPSGKMRIISSYYNFPLKPLFRKASKALTWLFRKIPKKMRHFTLHNTKDLKKAIKQGVRWLKRDFKTNTRIMGKQYDVKQMYTFLSHGEIRKAIQWLFEVVCKDRQNISTNCYNTRHQKNFITVANNFEDKMYDDECVRWGKSHSNENTTQFTIQQLQNIIDLDLKYIYATLGNKVLQQTDGCPIGGLLSAFYANVVCAYHEFNFLKSQHKNGIHVFGIRQMDDLILLTATDKNDPKTVENAKSVFNQFSRKENDKWISDVYKGGLELEPEEIQESEDSLQFEFAGTIITHVKETLPLTITCKTMNKNYESVLKTGKQLKHRYPHFDSHINLACKKGIIIGACKLIESQCTLKSDSRDALIQCATELQTIGYKYNFFRQTFKKLKNDHYWSENYNIISRQLLRLTLDYDTLDYT